MSYGCINMNRFAPYYAFELIEKAPIRHQTEAIG